MAQVVFHASKVLDEFTFVLFLLPSAKEMKDWKELASFTKSPSPGKHWELTQREYKRRGVMITFAAKVLEVPRTQSKKMQKM